MTGSALDVAGILAEHEPVLGLLGARAGIVGCSCLSARDYRAAGHAAGQAGWRTHVAAHVEALREADRAAAIESAVADYERIDGTVPDVMAWFRARTARTEPTQ